MRAMKRDKFRCTYCGKTGQDAELEIDHIVPVSKGGSHHVSNLTTACRECNQGKGSQDIEPPEQRPSQSKAKTTKGDPLVGMFLHVLEQDQQKRKRFKFRKQGVISGISNGFALVQLFEWGWGSHSNVEMIPLTKISDPEQVSLYASNEDMVYAHTEHAASVGDLVGTVEENMECWRSMRDM